MKHASNFNAAVTNPGYPIPRIDSFTSRTIQVETANGLRSATEITINGDNFLIRAIDPEVIVNNQLLVRFQIADDSQSITGYFFGTLTNPIQVVVDYGLGVRGEWTGNGSTTSPSNPLFLWLLLLLLFLLVFAVICLAVGGAILSQLGWILLISAIVVAIVILTSLI